MCNRFAVGLFCRVPVVAVLIALLVLTPLLGACDVSVGKQQVAVVTPTSNPQPQNEIVVVTATFTPGGPAPVQLPPSDTPVLPTPDVQATVQAALAATMAAMPSSTPVPPADTPVPPTPTWTPTPTATATSTPTPTSTPAPKSTAKPKPTSTPVPKLVVAYRDLHYECQGNTVWTRGRPPYGTVAGYRSFQVSMAITNQTADKTLDPPWLPARWIVTNGSSDREDPYSWQWVESGKPAYPQPPIGPGATASWTWLCYPLNPGEWVKAAEFTAWGHTYRFEFPKPELGDFNYYDCPH